MGLGKITRALGKVGMAFDALGYAIAGGKAVARAINSKRSEKQPQQEPEAQQDHDEAQNPLERA